MLAEQRLCRGTRGQMRGAHGARGRVRVGVGVVDGAARARRVAVVTAAAASGGGGEGVGGAAKVVCLGEALYGESVG